MALLDQAIALALATDTTPNPAADRSYRGRFGASLDLEQPITSDLGAFLWVGRAAGNVEAYEFVDIDRMVAVGGALKGTRWHRPDDTWSLAFGLRVQAQL